MYLPAHLNVNSSTFNLPINSWSIPVWLICMYVDPLLPCTHPLARVLCKKNFMKALMISINGMLMCSQRGGAWLLCFEVCQYFWCLEHFFSRRFSFGTNDSEISHFGFWKSLFHLSLNCSFCLHIASLLTPGKITLPTLKRIDSQSHTYIQPHPASDSLLLQPDGAISQKPDREQLFSWSHPHCRALTQGETNNLASLPQSQLCEPAGEGTRG